MQIRIVGRPGILTEIEPSLGKFLVAALGNVEEVPEKLAEVPAQVKPGSAVWTFGRSPYGALRISWECALCKHGGHFLTSETAQEGISHCGKREYPPEHFAAQFKKADECDRKEQMQRDKELAERAEQQRQSDERMKVHFV